MGMRHLLPQLIVSTIKRQATNNLEDAYYNEWLVHFNSYNDKYNKRKRPGGARAQAYAGLKLVKELSPLVVEEAMDDAEETTLCCLELLFWIAKDGTSKEVYRWR